MSLNINELIKIRKGTSRSEESIRKISTYISEFKTKVDEINNLDIESKRSKLINLMNEEASKRKKSLAMGASSYGDPEWAAPSACETWMHCILGGDNSEIKEAENIINELINTNRKNEGKKSNIIGFSVILVLCALAFYFFNWWAALILFVIGIFIFGKNYK